MKGVGIDRESVEIRRKKVPGGHRSNINQYSVNLLDI